MDKRRFFLVLILVAMAGLSVVYHQYFAPRHEVLSLQGETMGTYYRIKAVQRADVSDLITLKPAIEATLLRINKSLSTWDQQSWVSRFNADSANLAAQSVDSDFAQVMAVSQRIHAASDGALNPALAPLIGLWGFDRAPEDAWPQAQQVTNALGLSDFASVQFTNEGTARLQRTKAGIQLNFSAIAKGYGVDEIFRLLEQAGYTDLLVDIGGELRGKGRNDQAAWRVGVERPDQEGAIVQTITELHDEAIATSGDYRNFRMKDGVRFSHIIDPRTGYPITHTVASVSVRAENTMLADGWATALLVMGLSGLPVCERWQLACLMITRDGERYTSHESSHWVQ